ncbi:transcription factor Pcc1 [Nadsonia fulvescens var. elongata DSM 6958]|uniref:Transcription factor Pcc1 n=1 Tax=Nadsonia fulvescens var. elongata DSM 6958 TaxID=857566 RepID=A0A1E3PJ63_9ASCO|nr:transcription factor Pcc1 [Nadsonia fulvescens var. elongata DSM 6958]
MASLPYTLKLVIPFETSHHADIALQTLSPDPELKPDQLARAITISESSPSELVVEFLAVSDRVLRVGVNSMMDNLGLVAECLDELDIANFN